MPRPYQRIDRSDFVGGPAEAPTSALVEAQALAGLVERGQMLREKVVALIELTAHDVEILQPIVTPQKLRRAISFRGKVLAEFLRLCPRGTDDQ